MITYGETDATAASTAGRAWALPPRRASQLRTWLVATIALAAPATTNSADPPAHPFPPDRAMQCFQHPQDVRIELAAAEPAVVDPIAVRFDERGRMWVVEMRDYPEGANHASLPRSRIRCLEDRDADGYYETAQTFADNLAFATGLQPWNGGLIVTVSGSVVYLKDANEDGQADVAETWFTGFAEENPQLRANHPTLGPDGWIYVAGGLRGGQVRDARHGTRPAVSIRGRDFRFHPRTVLCDAVSGNSQFGLTFDDFGRRFVCMNAQPLDHVVLEQSDLTHAPWVPVDSVVHHVVPAELGRRVYPLVEQFTTAVSHVGSFTAACGILIYRGSALPEIYRGSALVCEPTGSLVHREILSDHGVTFAARPGEMEAEFLASRDPWFRPVNLESGPDGALYVVDMHRAVIEHPEWMPATERQRNDMRAGETAGRIYRVVAAKWRRPQQATLDGASVQQLVQLIGSSRDGWWHDTAARLLVERNDPQTAQLLAQVSFDDPIARARRLWLLEALGQLEPQTLHDALRDSDPNVREIAVLLARRQSSPWDRYRDAFQRLASDPAARVRFQVALAAAGSDDPQRLPYLVRIAQRDEPDPWMRKGLALAVARHVPDFLACCLANTSGRRPSMPALLHDVAAIPARQDDQSQIARVAQLAWEQDDRAAPWAILSGLAEALARRHQLPCKLLDQWLAEGVLDRARIETWRMNVRRAATNSTLDWPTRQQAMVLGALWCDDGPELLGTVFATDMRPSVRIFVAQTLAEYNQLPWPDSIALGDQDLPPTVQRAVINALLTGRERVAFLLDQIAENRIRPARLDPNQRRQLLDYPHAPLAHRAAELLAGLQAPNRTQVVAAYQSSLDQPGNPQHGRTIYQQHCANCHRLGTLGNAVGPDLSDIRTKTRAQLLEAILDPSAAIDTLYVAYVVVLHTGQTFTGVIQSESDAAVVLRLADGREVPLARSDIELVRWTGKSLMPDGFEAHLSTADMADLLAYLLRWRMVE